MDNKLDQARMIVLDKLDLTKIGLAFLAALGGMLMQLSKMRQAAGEW